MKFHIKTMLHHDHSTLTMFQYRADDQVFFISTEDYVFDRQTSFDENHLKTLSTEKL